MKKSILKGKNAIQTVKTVDLNGIGVTVTRKRMKTMRLCVHSSDRSVHLSIPTQIPIERAMLFLSSKEDWIRKKLAALPESAVKEARRYVSGESLDLWGERYPLTVKEGARGYSLFLSEHDRSALLSVPNESTFEKREKCIREYYRAVLDAYLSEAIQRWESITGLKSASHDIRMMKSRWGSCNVNTGHIRLNLRLAEHPKRCTDYVVLHELCHLQIPNHSKDFKTLLSTFMPDWKTVRDMLNGK